MWRFDTRMQPVRGGRGARPSVKYGQLVHDTHTHTASEVILIASPTVTAVEASDR